MAEKIIKTAKLPSGVTAIALETKTGAAIEIGTGTIFVDVQDLYAFVRLIKNIDKFFLRKR